jgi:hypothetical protein
MMVVGALVAVTATSPIDHEQRHTRTIFWDPERTIASLLQPDDETVIIDSHSLADPWTEILEEPVTTRQVIEDLAVSSDVVVVMDVESLHGVLAHQDSWVETRLEGNVREVLRVSSNHHVTPGQPIAAHLSFGEISIGPVLVKHGSTELLDKLVVPGRYLLFLWDDGEGVLTWQHTPAAVKNGVLEYAWMSKKAHEFGPPPHPLQGRTLGEVSTIVKRARKSWRWDPDDPPAQAPCSIYCK